MSLFRLESDCPDNYFFEANSLKMMVCPLATVFRGPLLCQQGRRTTTAHFIFPFPLLNQAALH